MTNVTVGREVRHEFGWLWARTKRLANLLLHPHILAGAVQMVEGLDRWCDDNNLPHDSVTVGDAKFIKGLQYVEYPLRTQ